MTGTLIKGKNSLSSKDAFRERGNYKKLFSTISGEFIDLWDSGNRLYGQVDLSGNYVLPNAQNMRSVNPGERSKKTTFMLDFAAEMFQDFGDFYKEAVVSRRIPSSENIVIEPIKGWSSNVADHHKVQQKIFNSYFNTAINNRNNEGEKVRDFDSFINRYVPFLSRRKKTNTPLLFSSYIRNRGSVLATGLAIEMSTDDKSDDQVKFEKYINDPAFKHYVSAANKHGFLVDQNAPWRLIVNLRSEYTKEYLMDYYGVNNLHEFFDLYYEKTEYEDARILKHHLLNLYNKIVEVAPTYSIKEITSTGTCVTKITREKLLLEEEMTSTRHDKLLIKTMLFLYAKEQNKNWNQEKFNKIYENTLSQLQRFGLNKALEHVSMYFGNKMQASASYVLTKDNSHSIIETSRTPGSFRF